MLWRGLVGSVLVLLGGLVVSVVPDSSWVGDEAVLRGLRTSELGRMLGLSSVMVGLALLALSWLVLCRRAATASRSDPATSIASARVAAATWSLPLLVAPPLFSRDGWSYSAQGMLAHLGISPYEHGPGVLSGPIVEAVDPRWMSTPTPYGPVPLAFGRLFASVTDGPWMLVIAHRGVAVLGLVLLAWAVPRLAAWTSVDPGLASALVLASPFTLANGVGGLHNDLLMVGLMAVALVVAAERGWVFGATLGGLAAAVKAPGGLICLGVALVTLPAAAGLVERGRRLVGVGVISVLVLLGAGLVAGTGSGWVHGLGVPGRVNVVLSVTTLVGGATDWTAGMLGLETGTATFLTLVRDAGTAVSLLIAGWVAWRWPTGRRDAAVSASTVAIGAVVLLSPVVHLWYLLWVLPFAACRRSSPLTVSALVALSVVLGLVAPLDSSLHGAYLAILLGTMLAVVSVLVLLATPTGRQRTRRIAAPAWTGAVGDSDATPDPARRAG